ncbi:nucleoside hydrolase [Actinomarinicola tropica]|uniref:Nucleoside hydrolase n=1 Tax=Actinomarinicola tropica TaxID=2789776 RepID=A0A5Q2RH94_9ACTN|nr:nucleoside hydrolase [Actinomarinicola tropica]QGG96208.1 nucleoside hydrolase [Actinomarinicola tropica]
MTPRPVIIDTDPGIDDAMAIAVALASPELDVLALTTVHGNHEVDVTTANALRILDLLERADVPVVAGAGGPIGRPSTPPATFVHGDDALGDVGYPPSTRSAVRDVDAATFIVDTVRARPGEVTLVPIGPLTNLALALEIEPRLAQLVDRVVVMGGAARVPGNITPTAEANIWSDPEAAEVVFGAGWPITMIGLDVTHQVTATTAWIDALTGAGTPAARIVVETAPVYLRFHRDTDGLEGIHCHDAAAVAWMLRPDLFTTEALPVVVSTGDGTDGATVVDGAPRGRPLVDVAVGVDADAVLALLDERLRRAV